MGQPPPGWYPDPSGNGGSRYWNGQRWTVAAPIGAAGAPRKSSVASRLLLAVGLLVLLGGCIAMFSTPSKHRSSDSGSSSSSTLTISTPTVSPDQLNPATYGAVTDREFALILKDPYAHYGERIITYGKVVQFDAVTGDSQFRADVLGVPGGRREDAMIEVRDPSILANVVEGDSLKMFVEVAGTETYTTQMGGSRTVAKFAAFIVEPARGR